MAVALGRRRNGRAKPTDDRWVRSACKMCLHGCGILVHVEDGMVTKMEGNPSDPDNLGKLCPKGNVGMLHLSTRSASRRRWSAGIPQKGPGIDPGWKEYLLGRGDRLVAGEAGADSADPTTQAARGEQQTQPHLQLGVAGGVRLPPLLQHIAGSGGTACHPMQQHHRYELRGGSERLPVLQLLDPDRLRRRLLEPSLAACPAAAKCMADTRMRGMPVVTVEPRMSPAAAKADEWVPIPAGHGPSVRPRPDARPGLRARALRPRSSSKTRTNATFLIGPDGTCALSADGKAMVQESVAPQGAGIEVIRRSPTSRSRGRYDVNGRRALAPRLPTLPGHHHRATPRAHGRDLHRPHGNHAASREGTTQQGRPNRRHDHARRQRGSLFSSRSQLLQQRHCPRERGKDSMALKMLDTLLGSIDMPARPSRRAARHPRLLLHRGPASKVWGSRSPHILRPPVTLGAPSGQPPDDEIRPPLGMDTGHITVNAILNPEKSSASIACPRSSPLSLQPGLEHAWPAEDA